MFCVLAICFLAAAVTAQQDPTFGGIFSTPAPYVHPDDYNPPQNVQDQFDWLLTKTVLKDNKNQNVIVSPLSVKILLTLLAEAAGQNVDSTTRRELEKVLPYNKSLFDAKDYFKKVLTSIGTYSENYTVNMGTKIFVDKDVSVNQRFASIAEHNYLAEIQNLTFDDARGSAQVINKWIAEKTKGKIHDLVSEDSVSNSVLLLINALYFEGTWRHGFTKTLTHTFYPAQGQKVEKAFVEQTGNFYYFFSKHYNAQILRMPYTGRRFSMFIILPKVGNDLNSVTELLQSESIKNEVWHMDETEVHIVMPKFRFDTSVNLNEVVKKIGIKDIFENTATLPLLARGGNSEGKLKVSNIIQKSGIIVDEKGTTAWAATEIELVNKFGGETREFIVDRPFLFYIEDDTTGAKLFAGQVYSPEF